MRQTILLDGRVSARECDCVDQLSHGSISHRPHRLQVIEREARVLIPRRAFFSCMIPIVGSYPLDDRTDLGLTDEELITRIGVASVQAPAGSSRDSLCA
jgi:hypothetical protein